MALPDTDYALATISNPSSALTDFTLIVDLSNMPSTWWADVDTSDGTKGRAAKDSDETELATDWIDFDNINQTGLVRVKWAGTLNSTGTQKLRIHPPVSENSNYSASDTYGSDNAYDSNFYHYWSVGGGEDRTINAESTTAFNGVVNGDSTGQIGSATEYDGTNQYNNFTPDTSYLGTNARTISFWTRPDSYDTTTNDGIIALIRGDALPGSGENFVIFAEDNGFSIGVFGCRYIYDKGNLSTGVWYHVVASMTDAPNVSDIDFYIDAVSKEGILEAGSDVAINTMNGGASDIGCVYINGGDIRGFDGLLNEVQIHTEKRPNEWIVHEYDQTSDNATFWGAWALIEAPIAEVVDSGSIGSEEVSVVEDLTDITSPSIGISANDYKFISDSLGDGYGYGLDIALNIGSMLDILDQNTLSDNTELKQIVSRSISDTYSAMLREHNNIASELETIIFNLQDHIVNRFNTVDNFLVINNIKVSQSFANISQSVGYTIDIDNIE